MPRNGLASCTDERFKALWYDLQSPTLVAKALGICMRSAQKRRKTIETRDGVRFPVRATNNNRTHNTAAIEPNRAVYRLQVHTGTVLVGSDAHIWPGPLTTMQRAFIATAHAMKPTAIIANGDFFDGARVSRFDHSSWSDAEKKPSVKLELEAVQDFMDRLNKAAPHAKKVWPLGNHDGRFEHRLVAQNPEYAGVQGTRLKDHFPAWTPCWRVDLNDDVIVRHRELGGEHADFRNVVQAGKSIVTGHDHRTGVVFWRNYTGIKYGVRSGYMCDSPTDPQFMDYLEGKEPNWHPAFVVLTFKDGRLLVPELVTKHDDDNVQFRGELWRV